MINSDFNRTLINFADEEKEKVLETLKKDSLYLLEQNLMDYSLLFVIEHAQDQSHPDAISRGQIFT